MQLVLLSDTVLNCSWLIKGVNYIHLRYGIMGVSLVNYQTQFFFSTYFLASLKHMLNQSRLVYDERKK